jgi:hypothetical protein
MAFFVTYYPLASLPKAIGGKELIQNPTRNPEGF